MVSIPQRLLGDALLTSAKNDSAKTAVIVDGNSYSYADLSKSAMNLSNYLIDSGIKKGDRVAIYMDNSWHSVVSIYSVMLSGAVFLIINPQTKSDKLAYILKDAEAKVLITTEFLSIEFLPALKDALSITECIVSGNIEYIYPGSHYNVEKLEYILSQEQLNSVFPNIIPNDLAALIYTSGSTGFPKGVMMTHQSMVFTSWSLIEYLRLKNDDRILLLLPLAFDYGLYQLLMSVTVTSTIIIEKSFIFTASIYKNIEKYRPTVFPGVPTIFSMMIAASKKNRLQFDFVNKITNTAAALPAEFVPDLKKIFPNALVFKMYGLTECKRVCYLEPELIEVKPNSVGKAIPGTEVFLLSPEGTPVAVGEPGILHVRGPHVMLGYWKKEELSKEMLKSGYYPGEKILCSNDWFKMDADGDLYFQGRNDDIIKTRGEKVSPIEIENVIYKINGVREVAAIGVPDPVMGESISVFLTTHSAELISEKDIQRACMKKLEPFMIPQRVIFLNEMPKSSNGKIDKKQLISL